MSSDQQLLQRAEDYICSFRDALVESDENFREVLNGRGKGFSSGAHGTVEFTDDLLDAARKLSARAVAVFGSDRIHERSVDEVARKIAFSSELAAAPRAVAKEIVEGIAEAATSAHRVLRPNPLFRFAEGVADVRVGPVRIVARESLASELDEKSSKIRIAPVTSEKNAFTLIQDEASQQAFIHLPEVCWDVSLRGMPKGLELQAMWSIDVAVSFIRLQYTSQPGLFPKLSDVEPHPVRAHQWHAEGLVIGPAGPAFGGGSAPTWYQIDIQMAELLSGCKATDAAESVFDPKRKSLAERMQQALGWLTRARRAHEPAERVLLFFTAIEALLTGGSKDAPITDTISRYAGVIWTADPRTRMSLYKTLKALYGLRSRIVHNGERSVAQIEANNIHYIAWNLAYLILRHADLSMPHEAFLDGLKQASFGGRWPPDLWPAFG